QATPKKWFGQVRRSWQMQKPRPGTRVLLNQNKIMLFLEEGTREHGPVTKKFLYIPLNRNAAMGWHPGLKLGVDYILRKRVKGTEARWMGREQGKKAQTALFEAMKDHIRRAIA